MTNDRRAMALAVAVGVNDPGSIDQHFRPPPQARDPALDEGFVRHRWWETTTVAG